MPPKTPDDKSPKKKSPATKKTTQAGTAAKKPVSKTQPSAANKRTTTSRTVNQPPETSYPGPLMALSEELRERIAQRAYEIHHRRGGEHGSDWEDWLQAEREILLQESPRS